MNESVKLFNDDFFNVFNSNSIKKRSIKFVCVDLPYGQTACEWDVKINLKDMWKGLKKICHHSCIYAFFCTTKYGVELINSNPRYFRYDLVWHKSNSVGFLSANIMPLRSHEMVYIFSHTNTDDIDVSHNLELRKYFQDIINYTKKTKAEIKKEVGGRSSHCMEINGTQFRLPTKPVYNILIDKYDIDKMKGFRKIEDLKKEYVKIKVKKTYNPQKNKGKPYIAKKKKQTDTIIYGIQSERKTINTGDRYPISIFKFNNPKKSLHPTQKPVALCEWLIKTYSNKNDTVLDFTMGSGSTGVACINTGRNFIGIEKDQIIFKVAEKRLS